jgi:hypothetical protein
MMEGTILFASTAVECAVNQDLRMDSVHASRLEGKSPAKSFGYPEWLSLSHQHLREAKSVGLPVEKLLGEGESIDVDIPRIRFVNRRHRIAHGDYKDFYYPLGSDLGAGGMALTYYADIAPPAALDQFTKCSNFLNAWVLQQPRIRDFVIKPKL